MARAVHADKITVVVIDEYPETAETFHRWLRATPDLRVVDDARTGREGYEVVRRRGPEVVLIAAKLPGMNGFQTTKLISSELATRVILLADDDSRETLQDAARAGARECLRKPPSPAELVAAIRRVARRPDDRPPPQASGGHDHPTTPRAGKIIAVCGTKGGVGRSMLAANLATAIALHWTPDLPGGAAGRIALIDANVTGGAQHLLFNIEHPRGLEALCNSDLDYHLIAAAASTHYERLDVFCSPQQPEEAGRFTSDAMKAILVEMREHYDLIIVDVSAGFDPATIKTIEEAHRLLAMTTLELSGVQRLRSFLDTIHNDVQMDHCWTVVNRMDGVYGVKPSSVEKFLHRRFMAILPEDPRTVNNAVNYGMPFVVNQRRAPITRAVHDLAKRLLQDLAQEATHAQQRAIVAGKER